MKDDLDKICITAENIQSNDTISRAEKLRFFGKEINQLNLSNDTKKFIIELSMKESSPSYEDYIFFAEQNGVSNWECTALQELHKYD